MDSKAAFQEDRVAVRLRGSAAAVKTGAIGADARKQPDASSPSDAHAVPARDRSACTFGQVFLCIVCMIGYGLSGFAGTVSGKVADSGWSLSWAVTMLLVASGRTSGTIVTGACMIYGENRKTRRIARTERHITSAAGAVQSSAGATREHGSEDSASPVAGGSTLERIVRSLAWLVPRPEGRVGGSALGPFPAVPTPRSPSPVEGSYSAAGGTPAAPRDYLPVGGSQFSGPASSVRATGTPRHTVPAPRLSDLLALVMGQVIGNAGYIPLAMLAKSGDVSLISPLMSLHTLFPITYGFCTGEAVTWAKVAGIGASFGAILLMGADSVTGGSGSAATGLTLAYQLALLLLTATMWGIADLVAVICGRRLRQKHVVLGQMAGVAIGGVFGGATLLFNLLSDGAAALPPATSGTLPGLLSGLTRVQAAVLIAAGHFMGSIGWLAYVRLGQLGDASLFAPVVQLYGIVTALLGFVLLQETAGPLKLAGILVAVGSLLLLGLSKRQSAALGARLLCRPIPAAATAPTDTAGRGAFDKTTAQGSIAGFGCDAIPAPSVGSDPTRFAAIPARVAVPVRQSPLRAGGAAMAGGEYEMVPGSAARGSPAFLLAHTAETSLFDPREASPGGRLVQLSRAPPGDGDMDAPQPSADGATVTTTGVIDFGDVEGGSGQGPHTQASAPGDRTDRPASVGAPQGLASREGVSAVPDFLRAIDALAVPLGGAEEAPGAGVGQAGPGLASPVPVVGGGAL